MPELPEVHTTATMLNQLVKDKQISDVWTDYKGDYHKGKPHIKNQIFFKNFRKLITNQRIESTSRKGKNVLIHLSNNLTIIIHMKMTGHLLVGQYEKIGKSWKAKTKGPLQESINQFIHFVITFKDNTHLVLSDVRKFAKVTFSTTTQIKESSHLSSLGPDPTEKHFLFEDFLKELSKKPNGKIKLVLLDQTIVSGIGNIYSDEILFDSGIHPQSIISKIPKNKLEAVFKSTKKLLAKGISLKGDSTSDYRNPLGESGEFHYHHQAYRNTNKQCSKKGCGGTIKRMVIGSRSSHFCNNHQKLYK